MPETGQKKERKQKAENKNASSSSELPDPSLAGTECPGKRPSVFKNHILLQIDTILHHCVPSPLFCRHESVPSCRNKYSEHLFCIDYMFRTYVCQRNRTDFWNICLHSIFNCDMISSDDNDLSRFPGPADSFVLSGQ